VSVLIKNGRVIDPKSGFDGVVDLFVNGNIIEVIDKNIRKAGADVQVLDA
jgi:dihydroorotase